MNTTKPNRLSAINSRLLVTTQESAHSLPAQAVSGERLAFTPES